MLVNYFSREEFGSHGLSEVVRIECRDVCRDGFGLDDVADAGEFTIVAKVGCLLDKCCKVATTPRLVAGQYCYSYFSDKKWDGHGLPSHYVSIAYAYMYMY